MNAVEASLKELDQKYVDGLLFPIDFCNAVVSLLVEKDGSEYNLKRGLSASTIARVVQSMNVMNAVANAGSQVISVGSSGTSYDHTTMIPLYLAVAAAWESAGWIEPASTGDNEKRWQSVQ